MSAGYDVRLVPVEKFVRRAPQPGSGAKLDWCDRDGILVIAGFCCCDCWEKWEKWGPENHFVAGESLLVIASITKIFDATAYERLDSGLRSTLVIRVYVYRDGKQEPLWEPSTT